MSGKLYAVGVGPGDPDLLTLKALKIIKNADCIACPKSHGEPGVAYGIAKDAVPEITSKELLLLKFPMRKHDLSDAHKKAAEQIIHYLSLGKKVAFLTLGDPGIYSTFFYIAAMIKKQGYEIEVISGITSFSAASAKLKLPLSLGDESLMITSGKYCESEGTLVIMKAGKKLKEIKEKAFARNKHIYLVENIGMPDEKVYFDSQSFPDEAGYFSLVIVK
ncbi:precorrin-2/cobalt-factor-2 C20-methyltransferase [Oribacterium sp. KHPX15]|uniref:precorrin-2 C(20)-methyltransferase n=1 Tax=Oribacterium sp. KHPX15 TaxID=1855342 RepID=UPI00089C83A8|nr:precorrin-2 C(20)-methyltransferase [Oribacterium sp. KHPX15]SEA04564.1 precorrin-2/cobalt-factor-2 C20-methyltransferase [Oribacterium sp. KHPX15]